MGISGDYHVFTDDEIARAPDQPGVYQLDSKSDIIYIGSSTDSIRGRLQRHKIGAEGRCTQKAEYFKTEVTSTPRTRERQLLEEYQAVYHRLPECNTVMP